MNLFENEADDGTFDREVSCRDKRIKIRLLVQGSKNIHKIAMIIAHSKKALLNLITHLSTYECLFV